MVSTLSSGVRGPELDPRLGEKIDLCFKYSETCVREPPLRLSLLVGVERWLSYKGTCHVILLAKLHDMYLFFHVNHYLK